MSISITRLEVKMLEVHSGTNELTSLSDFLYTSMNGSSSSLN